MVNLGDMLIKNKYAEQRRGSRDIYCNKWIRWSLRFLFYLPWSRGGGYVGGCWSWSWPSSSSSSSLFSYAPAFHAEWLPGWLTVRHHPSHSTVLLKVRSPLHQHWRWKTYLSQWRPLGSSITAVCRSSWRHGSPKPKRTWVICCLFWLAVENRVTHVHVFNQSIPTRRVSWNRAAVEVKMLYCVFDE